MEAQNLIDQYDVYEILEEVGLRILKALDLPEEFLDDRRLYSYSIEEYLVEHGRVKERDDDPFTARAKKEIMEIKKLYEVKNCAIQRLATGYIDGEKNLCI